MNFNIKLDRNFTIALNKMIEKYGEDFELLNGLHERQLNFSDFIDNFIDKETVADATIDGNANSSSKDICSLEQEKTKSEDKLFAFNKIFYEHKKKYGLETAREWLEAEWNGSFYLHDAPSSTYKPYCYAYDLEDLVNRGLFFIQNNFNPQPPKHLTTYTDFVGEFVSWTSNRTSGACGLPSFLIYSYYFWYNDVKNGFAIKSPEYYRDQEFQRIVYKLNQPYLRINQSAFTNFSIFDRNYLIELFGSRQFPDGEFIIDHIDQLIEYQKAFMKVVSAIRHYNMMTFPVLSFSLLFKNGKFVDEEFARWCSDHNWEWNDSNFFNGPDITSLSSCCRLVNDFTKLNGFINSIGGTSLKIGSVKVNTINLMRIAYESEHNEEKYLEILKQRVDLCVKTLDVIRHIIWRNVEKGLLPNYSRGLIDMATQYCTIGINAMYEAIRYFGYIETDEFGKKSYTDDGIRFASKIMDTINEVKDSYNFDYSINVEAVPGERCAIVLCVKDNMLYKNGHEDFIYSNQWIPLMEECSIQEKLRLGSILDAKCGGGQISHINIDSQFPNKEVAWEMLNKIAQAGVIYFAFNTRINVCKHNHGFYGNTCPTCGEPAIDSYQRIVGFLTPRSSYSKERKHEFDLRKWYPTLNTLKELG